MEDWWNLCGLLKYLDFNKGRISSFRNSMIKSYLDAPQFLASKKGDDASPRHELEQIGHLQDAPNKNDVKYENHCCPWKPVKEGALISKSVKNSQKMVKIATNWT